MKNVTFQMTGSMEFTNAQLENFSTGDAVIANAMQMEDKLSATTMPATTTEKSQLEVDLYLSKIDDC